MEFEAMETTIEDRVYDLEREVRRMIDTVNWLEATVEGIKLAQREEENKEEDNNTIVDSEKPDNNSLADIKLKIHIDTTEAIQQLQRIQKALITEEQLEQVKQELKEYWEENIYQKNTPANHNLLPKAEKEQLEKIKNGEIKNLCDLMMRRIELE